MSEKEKGYMPQSTAGLIRYYDEDTAIKLKPEHIIMISVFFTAIVIVMKLVA
ncbi:MAG: preprotein translocase subunit Sec61beta [Candidatus Aenigmatarchaeota archaeon]